MDRHDLAGVATGAGTSLVLIAVVAGLARLVGGDDVEGTTALLVVVGIFGAALFGGYVAARNVVDRPIFLGSMAGLATFVVAQLVYSLLRGQAPNAVGVVVFALLFMSLGAIGGFLPALLGTTARPPEDPS